MLPAEIVDAFGSQHDFVEVELPGGCNGRLADNGMSRIRHDLRFATGAREVGEVSRTAAVSMVEMGQSELTAIP